MIAGARPWLVPQGRRSVSGRMSSLQHMTHLIGAVGVSLEQVFSDMQNLESAVCIVGVKSTSWGVGVSAKPERVEPTRSGLGSAVHYLHHCTLQQCSDS